MVPCTNNHQELSDQMPVTRFCQKTSNADQNEDEMHDFSTAYIPSSSTISSYSDMYQAMSMIRHDMSTYSTIMALRRREGCHEHLSRDMYQQHPIFTYIRQRRGFTSQINQNGSGAMQSCRIVPNSDQVCTRSASRQKPNTSHLADVLLTLSSQPLDVWKVNNQSAWWTRLSTNHQAQYRKRTSGTGVTGYRGH